MIESPLIVPEDGASTTGGQVAATGAYTTTSTPDGAAGANSANPVDEFFAGTRWRRDDVVFALAALNLVLVLINIWTSLQVRKQ
ncbi:hypothetical protein [Natronosalvus halobius]|uniref:hypothetical protein n=1 Tax=Natronosalvus halobius TaxID=2953746 RepID=UPI00209C92E9|nr:hypothetical protein [Natronosalvus halobius]USZ73238.1 hypothetical protein NGM15_08060 [Natronosalvus halobius]